MSTHRDSLTPVPARQAATCMCVQGSPCSSFAPGHALHLIQSRLVSATPREWIDAIVEHSDAQEGTVVVRAVEDGAALTVWNGSGAALAARPGEPVALHVRYHVLAVGQGTHFNVALTS